MVGMKTDMAGGFRKAHQGLFKRLHQQFLYDF
jgi:hypothetical protein